MVSTLSTESSEEEKGDPEAGVKRVWIWKVLERGKVSVLQAAAA